MGLKQLNTKWVFPQKEGAKIHISQHEMLTRGLLTNGCSLGGMKYTEFPRHTYMVYVGQRCVSFQPFTEAWQVQSICIARKIIGAWILDMECQLLMNPTCSKMKQWLIRAYWQLIEAPQTITFLESWNTASIKQIKIVWWPDSVGGLDFEYARSPRQLNGNNFFVSGRT